MCGPFCLLYFSIASLERFCTIYLYGSYVHSRVLSLRITPTKGNFSAGLEVKWLG